MTEDCGPDIWLDGSKVNKLKIHILFGFREGPWGGCNQFLTALRDEFLTLGNWAASPECADVLLFDSFNEARDVIRWKWRLPEVPFVQRIDGPISGYRGNDRHLDRLIHAFGERIADGIVFQSKYSRQANRLLGMPEPRFSTVILNAPQTIFKPGANHQANDRIRIVSVSWSPNWNKGFDILAYLDRHLDFSRFEMTFVGNSPVQFKNIRQLPPQKPRVLAELLPNHDIFLTASRHDPCSNALSEALAAGLPAIALRSGGHPEILRSGGVLFDGANNVLRCIDKLAAKLSDYKEKVKPRVIAEVAEEYLHFLSKVYEAGRPRSRLTYAGIFRLYMYMLQRYMLLAKRRFCCMRR